MAKTIKINTGCVWYSKNSASGCRIMTELICAERKCSFCETEKDYKERMRIFRETHSDMNEKKVCEKCRQFKDFEEFNFSSASKDGRERYCRECKAEMKKVRRI